MERARLAVEREVVAYLRVGCKEQDDVLRRYLPYPRLLLHWLPRRLSGSIASQRARLGMKGPCRDPRHPRWQCDPPV